MLLYTSGMKTVADKSPVVNVRLREIMEAQGITVVKLSQKSGVPRQTIYNILRYPVGIQFDTLARICKALGIEASDLLKIEEVKR